MVHKIDNLIVQRIGLTKLIFKRRDKDGFRYYSL